MYNLLSDLEDKVDSEMVEATHYQQIWIYPGIKALLGGVQREADCSVFIPCCGTYM